MPSTTGSRRRCVNKRRAILDRIRCCGRLGAEQEARRPYLNHCIDFRQYRAAYETGRQEARKMQPMLKEQRFD